jgi:outer membrane protein assembly factor BamB
MLKCACTMVVLMAVVAPLARSAQTSNLGDDLVAAAKKGDADAVKALLAKGADVNAKNAYGATALSFAADKGHLAVVKLLLQNKADVNVQDTFYKSTPLNWAVMRKHVDIIKALVEAGATGTAAALRSAAGTGQRDVVQAILEAGKLKEEDLSKALAATPSKHAAVAELLRKAGAKTPAKTEIAVDAKLLDSYVGTYRGDRDMEPRIAIADGKLTLQFGAGTPRLLKAIDKASFQTADGDVTITFERVGEGKASSLTLKTASTSMTFKRVETAKDSKPALAKVEDPGGVVKTPLNWPSFRGPFASGNADGQFPPLTWDAAGNRNIRWKTPIPGLGLSCPVVWEDRIYLSTAVSTAGKSALRPGLYGDVDSVNDSSEHSWRLYCLDKRNGAILWERTACKGVPKVKRHPKASHANPTPATDGAHIVVSFGSEGLYCYDRTGKLLWQKNLGVLDSGWFYDADYQWGFGSSPILYKDLAIVQCDVGKDSFLAAYRVGDGHEVWRKSRDEVPSWGTPTIVEGPQRVELVTNATRYARGYDPLTGQELWRLGRHSEITVPAPIYGAGLIFITNGYRPVQPIYAVRPGASGDISLKEGATTSDAIAWSSPKGGPYMPTPIVYGDYLYTCSNAGIVTCYGAKTGKQVYKERLGGQGGYTASGVAADGYLYFTSEENGIFVVKAGPKFELVAVNLMGEGEPCLATPAISDGMLFVRTHHYLFGIGRTVSAKQ